MTGPRRWIGYIALVLVFSIACGVLSWWQFARNEEAQERVRQVVENWDRAPVGLGALLASPDAAFDPADTWTPVVVTGAYDPDGQLVVRGRPREGQPGFEVLVPFHVDGGGTLIIDRGWVPAGQTQAEVPDSVPAPPLGPVTVVARLKAGEPSVPGRTAPAGQVATIELPLIAELLEDPAVYTGAYGLLASEDPAVETPALARRPEPDPGPHLSYAVQWILFAVLAAGALTWVIVQEVRIQRGQAPLRRPEPKRPRGASDAEIEDAMLDEAER